jgi:hypothetical protein
MRDLRDRWISLPSLEVCRDWWVVHKFKDSWGA